MHKHTHMQKLLPESSPSATSSIHRLQAHRNLSVEAKISALGRKINKATRTAQCASFASTAGAAPGLLWLSMAGWLASCYNCIRWVSGLALLADGVCEPG